MKHNSILAFLFICVFCFQILSCQEKFKDEDLILLYVKENLSKFDRNKDFYILILRNVPLTCASSIYGYDADFVIDKVKDSLNTEKLYLLYENDYFIADARNKFTNGNLHFVKETTDILDSYAFPYTPHLFHIKNNSIKSWKEVYYKPKDKHDYFPK